MSFPIFSWRYMLFIIHEPGLDKDCAQCTTSIQIYFCVRQKILKPMHLCRPFFPLHIAFCQLSVLGFHCFLQQTTIIVLFSGMFFTLKIKKSLMLPCIKLPVTGTLLSGGCRTLRTYKM